MAPVTPPLMPFMPPPSVYKVGGPSTVADEGPSFPLPTPGFLIPPSMIEDLSTCMSNLEYGHGQLVKKVIQAIGRLEQISVQIEQGQQAMTQSDEVIGGLTQQVLCALNVNERLCRFCEAMIWLRT
ncbi:hypothetical protein Tco_0800542 [Tanacetum coccineum]|uniref:Uncharacterized protein n=1 Tax=Tanacetum coccineum TaxID=301880 RepID=A0ABQ4ZTF8_9ASTR